MIKKFNENWGTFEEYLEVNEPGEFKEGDRVVGIGKDFATGLDINGQRGTVLKKIHHQTNRYDCLVQFDHAFSDIHMLGGPNFKPGEKRKCLWVYYASLKFENSTTTSNNEDEKILFEVGDKVIGVDYFMNVNIDGKKGFIEEIKKTPKTYYLVRFIKPAFGPGRKDLLWLPNASILPYVEKNKNYFLPNKTEDDLPYESIEFDTKSFEVVGLPSGQIIYMNDKQIKYFKTGGLILYTNIWKKPISGGFVPIKLGKYVFEDPSYQKIINIIDKI